VKLLWALHQQLVAAYYCSGGGWLFATYRDVRRR